MDTRTDNSVFRTVRFTCHTNRSATRPGSTIPQTDAPNPVAYTQSDDTLSLLEHPGPRWPGSCS